MDSGQDFGAFSHRQQVARLRSAALRVLRGYPIAVARLRLVQLAYNAAFSVLDEAGCRYALRINVNSLRTPANLAAEVAWLRALRAETDLQVPLPIANRAGSLVSAVRVPGMAQERPAVLFEWVEGQTLGEAISAPRARQIGRLMARLHEHGAGFRLPPGAELPTLADYLWNLPDRLTGNVQLLGVGGEAIVRTARGASEPVVAAIWAAGGRQPLHADLHGWNLLHQPGRVAAIDFDDSAIGSPLQDIGVSAYYQDDYRRYLDALLAGYEEVRSAPKFTDTQLHALFAQRNIMMLNDLLDTQSAELLEMIPKFAEKTIIRLRHYLETGEFRVWLE